MPVKVKRFIWLYVLTAVCVVLASYISTGLVFALLVMAGFAGLACFVAFISYIDDSV
jgi:hypothetical protein